MKSLDSGWQAELTDLWQALSSREMAEPMPPLTPTLLGELAAAVEEAAALRDDDGQSTEIETPATLAEVRSATAALARAHAAVASLSAPARELLSLGLPSPDHRARLDDVARDLAGLVAFGERYAAEMRFDRGPKLQEPAVILAWRTAAALQRHGITPTTTLDGGIYAESLRVLLEAAGLRQTVTRPLITRALRAHRRNPPARR